MKEVVDPATVPRYIQARTLYIKSLRACYLFKCEIKRNYMIFI